MMETIMLQEVVNRIDAGEAFDIEYCTYNRKTGQAGRLVAYAKAVKHMNQRVPKRNLPAPETKEPGTKTNPNHKINATRNLYLSETQEIKKVHLRLITLFNGKRVL